MVAVARSAAGVKVSPSTGKNTGVPSSVPVWIHRLIAAVGHGARDPRRVGVIAMIVSQSVVPYLNVHGIGLPIASSVASPTLPQKYAVFVTGHGSQLSSPSG